MSTPSFSNIDRWLFEWREGNLSPKQIEQLKTFILLNPELEIDKDMWELSYVQSSKVIFPNADKLKRKRRLLPILLRGSVAFVFLITLIAIYFVSDPFTTSHSINNKTRVGHSRNPRQSHVFPTRHLKSTQLRSNQRKSLTSVVFPVTTIPSYSSNLKAVSGNDQLSSIQSQFSDSLLQFGNLSDSDPIQVSSQMNLSSELPEFNLSTDELSTLTGKENTLNDLPTGTAKLEPLNKLDIISIPKAPIDKENISHKPKVELSLDMRWRKFSRTVKRMVDNPIALKNVKDPIFLTPGMQTIDVNFGSTGKLLATRIQATSRAQWLGESNEQFISQFAIDGYSYAARGGIGLQLNNSYYSDGKIQHSNAALIYSPKLSISRNIMLEPSIRFKMGNKSLNSSLLVPGQYLEIERNNLHEISSENFPSGRSLWYRDIGAGIQLNTKWFYIGGQMDNLAQHYDNMFQDQQSQSQRSDLHSIISVGTEYESIRKTMSFSPYIIYQKKGDFEETWFGAQFRYHWITAGLAVSDQLEPATSIGLKFKHIMLLYSADYLKSSLLKEFKLSHQLTLRITTKPSRFAQRLLNQL